MSQLVQGGIMVKKSFLFSIAASFGLLLHAQQSIACGMHLYFNPDDYGPVGGSVIRMAGLAPPEPAFKIKHAPTTKAIIGEQSEILVNYERPWRSKHVKLKITGTKNIELIDTDLALEDREGAIPVRFKLVGKGYNNLTLIVSGEHKGETLSYYSKIFVGAAPEQQEKIAKLQAASE